MNHAGFGEAWPGEVDGDPEVRQVGVGASGSGGVEEDVRRFDVAVYQMGGMHGLETGQELSQDLGGEAGRQGAVVADQRRE